jgi:hypothetical protein
MKSDNSNNFTFIGYALLSILIIFIFSLSFKYKFKTAQNYSFRSLTNQNSNATNIKEGFSFNNNNSENKVTNNASKVETESLFKIIDNKLKGLMQELGGEEGNAETKKLLTSTKKICDLECAKCMTTMISEQKSLKTIDLENIMSDETNENCLKCRKYTELSKSIDSIINNL